jgi:hypothetical protein
VSAMPFPSFPCFHPCPTPHTASDRSLPLLHARDRGRARTSACFAFRQDRRHCSSVRRRAASASSFATRTSGRPRPRLLSTTGPSSNTSPRLVLHFSASVDAFLRHQGVLAAGVRERCTPSAPVAPHPSISRAAAGKELLCWFSLMQYVIST